MTDVPYIVPMGDFFLTNDHFYRDRAAVMIIHMPTLHSSDPILNWNMKRDDELWVFWSMECEAHRPWQYQPDVLSLFDIMATHKLDSDIPVPYLDVRYLESFRRPPCAKTGFVNAFISSHFNLSKRLETLEELMKYIDIHSYGKCMHNYDLVADEGMATKENVIASYLFTIAFENTVAEDYVTEKFFQPLEAGSVPIYLGAPNIDEFAPGNRCFINVSDFLSIPELAEYLQTLNADPAAYDSYHAWRTEPLRDTFLAKIDLIATDALLRLCQKIKMQFA